MGTSKKSKTGCFTEVSVSMDVCKAKQGQQIISMQSFLYLSSCFHLQDLILKSKAFVDFKRKKFHFTVD